MFINRQAFNTINDKSTTDSEHGYYFINRMPVPFKQRNDQISNSELTVGAPKIANTVYK